MERVRDGNDRVSKAMYVSVCAQASRCCNSLSWLLVFCPSQSTLQTCNMGKHLEGTLRGVGSACQLHVREGFSSRRVPRACYPKVVVCCSQGAIIKADLCVSR